MAIDRFTAAARKDINGALAGMLLQHRQLLDVGAKHGLDLSKFMFGTIIWNRSLGRPSAPRLSDGFIVRLTATTVVLGGDGQGGPAHDYHLHTDSYPGKWDDSDADHYLVHFLQEIPEAAQLDLHVTIADGINWVDEANKPNRGGHFMSPSVRSFGRDNPMPNWIEPFNVVSRALLEVTQPA